MNVALFFEGTGQGVAGRHTNVTRLRDLCVEDDGQRLHLEGGPGVRFGAYAAGRLHGAGWRQIFRRARDWFDANAEPGCAVYLFGFSRGALIARHFAEWLEGRGLPVAFLGLWDTVDATVNLDVAVTCPANVRAARHAVSRDERRRCYGLVPLAANPAAPGQSVAQLVFPGVHSDVGGLYADSHVVADAALAWVAEGARRAGLRLKRGAGLRAHRDYAAATLHDEEEGASNLWGALGTVRRTLTGLRRHASCRFFPVKEADGASCP